jgi:outer membrane protein TolC
VRTVALILILLPFGCSRSHYRKAADRETYPVIAERVVTPQYAIGRMQVEPAPQSRLADLVNPDAPPKPPDDPAAAGFMARPGGFRGYKHWEKDGVADRIEPPGWENALGLEPDGTLKLNQEKAMELALVHSREYQTQLEGVYLSALALTLNRFDFAIQWFGRQSLDYTHIGASSLPAESNTLRLARNRGFNQNLAAGGQLLVDFANSFVWEFTGQSHTVGSTFAVTLLQPLLRNFGRNIRLESLTQAERDTLYAVRNLGRFRKQFWANITTQPGGYLDLMLQLQSIRNAKENLRNQEENYKLVQELFRGNKRSVVEVDQTYQGLLSARQQQLDAEVGLQNSLDAYKLRLGLPPRIPIELDDSPLQQFVLLDPEVEKTRLKLEAFDKARKAELDAIPDVATLKKNYDQLQELAQEMSRVLDRVDADMKTWNGKLETAKSSAEDTETRGRTKQAYQQQTESLVENREALTKLVKQLREHQSNLPTDREKAWKTLTGDVKSLTTILNTGTAAQTLARIYSVQVTPVELTEESAMGFAKMNRLDLQNSLGGVTDAWRKVTVAANALKADLNLRANGTLVTDPTSKGIFDFTNQGSRLSVGLQFDSPLVRQAERNAYRASLIQYQVARRTFMSLSDQVEQQIRFDLRSLRQAQQSFEIARQQLIAAARQVENERILLSAPAQGQGQGGGNSGDTTLRTLRALDQLNSARNAVIATFVRYEQQRVQLLLDLEALQLDERGFPNNVTGLDTATGSIPSLTTPNNDQPPAPEQTPEPAK